jgi:hypothetical protein
VPDFLDEKRDEIDKRLAELEPLVAEYDRLRAAAAALAEVDERPHTDTAAIPRPGESSLGSRLGESRQNHADDGAGHPGDELGTTGESVIKPVVPMGSSAAVSELVAAGSTTARAVAGETAAPKAVEPRPAMPAWAEQAGVDGPPVEYALAEDVRAAEPSPQALRESLPPPQSPGASAAGSPVRKAGRPKGSGTRAAEALRIVREHPGVTIPELADRMGIKQNYLYRVLPELVQEGKVTKEGRGWHPRAL